MNYNNDFKYDLKVGQVAEKDLGELLGKKIEVKRDLQAHQTGNVYVEYKSRGKWSGISKTESDYYCFVIRDNRYILILTNELKEKCRKYLGTKRDKAGGDSDTSKGILLPIKELFD